MVKVSVSYKDTEGGFVQGISEEASPQRQGLL